MTKQKKRVARQPKAVTYDVDIAQEFKDVKSSIDGLREDLNAWKSIFDKQLDKLNENMTNVLNRLADHETRIGVLERVKIQSDTKHETISEMSKFGWWILRAAIGAGIVIGGVLGTASAWKLIFPS